MNGPPSVGPATAAAAAATIVVCVREHRPAAHALRRQHATARERHAEVAPAAAAARRRIDLQLDQLPDRVERVAEQEPRPLERAEQVADHREAAALDPREVERRPAGLVDPALDLGRLQVRVDLGVDADQLAVPLEVVDARAQAGVRHWPRRLPGAAPGSTKQQRPAGRCHTGALNSDQLQLAAAIATRLPAAARATRPTAAALLRRWRSPWPPDLRTRSTDLRTSRGRW